MSSQLARRIEQVRQQIAGAAAQAGRQSSEIELIAVSKKHPVAALEEAMALGVTSVGENFVQEMLAKRQQLVARDQLRWHYIGRLQRNKVKPVVGQTCLIHAVDKISLAAEIDRQAHTRGLRQPILISVNLGGEASKGGLAFDELPALLRELRDMRSIECAGLMTMPPLGDDPEASRPFFRRLRTLRDDVRGPGLALGALSMGTTHDFEMAILEGATMVRVGTAIFGARPPAK